MSKSLETNKLINYKKKLFKNKTIVLATGVFDILHVEHLRFLKKAKQQGNILIVGIESDRRVRKLKGQGRPINAQEQRAKAITALGAVDYVFILPENLGTRRGKEELIKNLKPNIYAVSASTPFIKEKQRIMRKFEGELKIIHPHNSRVSTTKIINTNNKIQKPQLN